MPRRGRAIRRRIIWDTNLEIHQHQTITTYVKATERKRNSLNITIFDFAEGHSPYFLFSNQVVHVVQIINELKLWVSCYLQWRVPSSMMSWGAETLNPDLRAGRGLTCSGVWCQGRHLRHLLCKESRTLPCLIKWLPTRMESSSDRRWRKLLR